MLKYVKVVCRTIYGARPLRSCPRQKMFKAIPIAMLPRSESVGEQRSNAGAARADADCCRVCHWQFGTMARIERLMLALQLRMSRRVAVHSSAFIRGEAAGKGPNDPAELGGGRKKRQVALAFEDVQRCVGKQRCS